MRPLRLALAAALLAPANLPAQSPPPVVLEDVAIVDVVAGETVPHRTLVVEGDRIAAIGAAGDVEPPAGASVIRGGTVIPGLWDLHVHAMREGRALWHYPLDLAHGVTGVREMGTFLDSLDVWKGRLRASEVAPRLVAAGHIVDGPRPAGAVAPPPGRPTPAWFFAIALEDPAAAPVVVDSLVRRGVDFVKVYSGLSRDAYHALAEAANARGVPFAGHVPEAVTALEAARAGQRSIEHLTGVLEACLPASGELEERFHAIAESGLPADSMAVALREVVREGLAGYDPALCAPTFAALREREVAQVPTLVVFDGQIRASEPGFADDPRRRWVPDAILARWNPPEADPEILRMLQATRIRLVGDLHAAGVPILAGTDASDETGLFPGAALHDELGLLVEAGLEPIDALRAATIEPARFLGHADSLGSVEAGKLADLVVLEGDPLEDIGVTRRIRAVVIDGTLYDRDELDRLLDRAQTAARGGARE